MFSFSSLQMLNMVHGAVKKAFFDQLGSTFSFKFTEGETIKRNVFLTGSEYTNNVGCLKRIVCYLFITAYYI